MLSGYNHKKNEFFRNEKMDAAAHPQYIPDAPVPVSDPRPGIAGLPLRESRITNQEYYLVNIDSKSFIAMNEPVFVTPYQNWDQSSFKAAYKVESNTSTASPYQLFNATAGMPTYAEFGMTKEEYNYFTDYGNDERILMLAEKITASTAASAELITRIGRLSRRFMNI